MLNYVGDVDFSLVVHYNHCPIYTISQERLHDNPTYAEKAPSSLIGAKYLQEEHFLLFDIFGIVQLNRRAVVTLHFSCGLVFKMVIVLNIM